MDVFDQATELERLDRESALMRARAAIDRGGPEMIDGVACCRDCGEPIPLKRLEAANCGQPTLPELFARGSRRHAHGRSWRAELLNLLIDTDCLTSPFQLNKVKSEKWFKTHLSLDSVIGC